MIIVRGVMVVGVTVLDVLPPPVLVALPLPPAPVPLLGAGDGEPPFGVPPLPVLPPLLPFPVPTCGL